MNNKKNMVETDFPLTVYGLLARRHRVKNEDYVGKIVRGDRRAIRGKAAEILADWHKLKDNIDDWFADFKSDGAIVVNMDDIEVQVYIQKNVASIYKKNELQSEVTMTDMSLNGFKDFLNGVRIDYTSPQPSPIEREL